MTDTFKLDPAVKADWIAALRSGKYTQDRGQLKTCQGYCCLGVLCDIGGADVVECGPGRYDYTYKGASVESGYLPTGFIDMPWVVQVALAERNDHGMNFNEIADYIEEHY